MALTIAFAFSVSMPCEKVSSCETYLPLCSRLPYLSPRSGTPRLANFSTSTARAASRRCSVLLRTFNPFSGAATFSSVVSVPLKS